MKSIGEEAVLRVVCDEVPKCKGCNDIANCKDRIFYIAFKAGATFAQEWISVEDELPEDEAPVLTKIEFLDANDEKAMEDETLYSVAGYSKTIQQWIKEIHYYFPGRRI